MTHIDKSILIHPTHSNITLDLRNKTTLSLEEFEELWNDSKEWVVCKLKEKKILE